MKIIKLSLFLVLLFVFKGLHAQKINNKQAAFDYIAKNHLQWGLSAEDVADIRLSDHYVSDHNGVHHFYLQQGYKGIDIHNAIWGVHLKANGRVAHQNTRFYKNVSRKVNAHRPEIAPEQALSIALQKLEKAPRKSSFLIKQKEDHSYVFDKKAISQLDIPVELNFFPTNDQLILAWSIGIYPPGSSAYWQFQVDATTGVVLKKENLTLNCTFEHGFFESSHYDCIEKSAPVKSFSQDEEEKLNDGARYRVFPAPVESPLHGSRQLLIDPADPLASPYGWHDTNAVAGPEFFITKGNNVHAYFDTQNNNRPDGDETTSEDLVFDFPYQADKEPAFNRDAGLTQLFYMNNFMHDFAYHYGFDEQAGNYQNYNYRTGGVSKDPVMAEGMDGARLNNANFLPLPDGNPGRMQMYLWDSKNSQLLNIFSPEELQGSFVADTATFGPSLKSLVINGTIVEAYDNTENPNLGCETIVNKREVEGKIALVYRGKCTFVQKVLNAQAAGARAVIVANYDNTTVRMGGGNNVEPPLIPVISVSSSTADRLRFFLDRGIQATIQLPSNIPERLDASFDNGVIAHEYAHGISNRLTSGPKTAGCLRNDEQMGEGWSDFFGLVTSTRSSDREERTKGIGTFIFGSQLNGGGIRRRPYSPQLEINELTYNDIVNTSGPHRVGEVWASMLWDLYWAFSDEYGWDQDLFFGEGGNNMAIQLVMDGMKLQPCSPGFVDARNAILKADSINYNGANQCLIWEVFAKRGLGYSADQGDSDDRRDGAEAYDILPACIKKLKIKKEATRRIEAGEIIQYRILISNDKPEPVRDVIINDQIPEGATVMPFGVVGAELLHQRGNELTFRINEIRSGQTVQFLYSVETAPELGSRRLFFDDFDEVGFTWQARARSGGSGWRIVTDTLRNFEKSWFVPNRIRTSNHLLELRKSIAVAGQFPVVRIFHHYVTEPVGDGGFIEISTDDGSSWEAVRADQLLRDGYDGELAFSTVLLHDQEGFTGNRPGMRETIVDLSPYMGQEVRIRFQFHSDSEPNEGGFEKGIGWTIDAIEFMDLLNYNMEVCATTAQGDFVCARAEELGTTVGSVMDFTSAEGLKLGEIIQMEIFPNPAEDFVQIQLDALYPIKSLVIELFASDGRLLQSSEQDIRQGPQVIPVDVSRLPSGMYWMKIQHNDGVVSRKIMVK